MSDHLSLGARPAYRLLLTARKAEVAATRRRRWPVAAHPADEGITFYLTVHRDLLLAERCVRLIRQHYPGSPILMVSDGDDDPGYTQLGRRYALDYRPDRWLYGLPSRGALLLRMLRGFLQAPTPWLIKVDTDTLIHRRLRWLPVGMCVFGTLEQTTSSRHEPLDPPNVQGGCVGMTQAAATRLLESGALESPWLADPRATWASCLDMTERLASGLVSFDFMLRWACIQARVSIVEFPEVLSQWRGPVANARQRYALTHPHKDPGDA
jgi:hypothetical protein